MNNCLKYHLYSTGRRKKRASLKGLGAYDLIAGVSGGSVYVTDKTNIAAVVDIIKVRFSLVISNYFIVHGSVTSDYYRKIFSSARSLISS